MVIENQFLARADFLVIAFFEIQFSNPRFYVSQDLDLDIKTEMNLNIALLGTLLLDELGAVVVLSQIQLD